MKTKTDNKVKEEVKLVNITREEIAKERAKKALYVNKTTVSEEMINKFYKFYKYRVKRLDFYSFLISGILLLIVSIIRFFNVDEPLIGIVINCVINIVLIIIGGIFIFTALKPQKCNITVTDSENMATMNNEYYFEDENVIIVNKDSQTTKTYKELSAVYESDGYYYLFTNRRNAYIIKKDCFTKGIEYKFRLFIIDKMGRLYKKRYVKRKR